ncbi:MAG: PilW family protein [Rhodanobacteraceae bacterium]
MIRARRFLVARRRMAGLSLIEMMIALVMAFIVAAGIIAVFSSTSSSNKAQAQMAVLQEEGRFAIHSLRSDLANVNGGYCSNSGGNAGVTSSGLYLDALRSPIVYSSDTTANTNAIHDNTLTMATPTQAFVLPSNLFMRGYQCTTTACTPADPNTTVSAIPPMGIAIGDRVMGTDVLTVRYIRPGSGWAIVPSGSAAGTTISPTSASSGIVATIALNPLPGEDAASEFKSGDLAMLATCSMANVYSVTVSGDTITPTSDNYAQPPDISQGNLAAPTLFDFTQDFQTVTYFLEVVDAGNGHTTGELVRRVNGTDQPLVRGVERLDFRYGILDADGGTRFLTAAEVDSAVDSSGNSIPCPPQMPPLSGVTADSSAGCLWRAVQTIEVHILMDGQTPLYTLTPAEMNYIYSIDGNTTPQPPGSTRNVTPAQQGFPNQLLRREFTTLVALRNFNP